VARVETESGLLSRDRLFDAPIGAGGGYYLATARADQHRSHHRRRQSAGIGVILNS